MYATYALDLVVGGVGLGLGWYRQHGFQFLQYNLALCGDFCVLLGNFFILHSPCVKCYT